MPIAPRNARVLITGASGFIARHALRPLLDAGCNVIASAHAPPPASITANTRAHPSGLSAAPHDRPGRTDEPSWTIADLLTPGNAAALIDRTRPTHLLHCAWNATPGEFWTSPENEAWLASGRELIDAFIALGGQRAVLVGTCAEYDWPALVAAPELADRIDERLTPTAGTTLYARCKLALANHAEHACRAAGVSQAWARIFFLYGPDEHPARLVSGLVRSMLTGQPARCNAPLLERDFIDSRDAGAALASILLSDVRGPVNVASGSGITLGQLARTLADYCGTPGLLTVGDARPADQPPRLVASVARLYDEAGFRPRYPLALGLRDAVEWWRHHLRHASLETP